MLSLALPHMVFPLALTNFVWASMLSIIFVLAVINQLEEKWTILNFTRIKTLLFATGAFVLLTNVINLYLFIHETNSFSLVWLPPLFQCIVLLTGAWVSGFSWQAIYTQASRNEYEINFLFDCVRNENKEGVIAWFDQFRYNERAMQEFEKLSRVQKDWIYASFRKSILKVV